MTQRKANLTWRENDYSIAGKKREQISFTDTKPNHFIIKNHGSAPVYIGLTYTPRPDYYDLKVEKGSVGVTAKVNGTPFIWVYNDGQDKANVQITSYYDEDINANFMTSAAITAAEMAEIIGSQGGLSQVGATINGYTVPLPSGANHIGSVSLDQTDPLLVSLVGAAYNGTSLMVSDATAIGLLRELVAALATIITNQGGAGGSVMDSYARLKTASGTIAASDSAGIVNAGDMKLVLLTNDSDISLGVRIYYTENDFYTFTLKSGESLTDVFVPAVPDTGQAKILVVNPDASATAAYRCMWGGAV